MKLSTAEGSLFKRWLSQVLVAMLAFTPILSGQTPAPPTPAPQNPPAAPATPQAPAAAPTAKPMAGLPIIQGLKLIPLAGRNGMNDLERKVMSPLVVQVLDQNDRPVESAEVVFRFPLNGPGAAFRDGKTSLTVHTNGQGQAAAMNWQANDKLGSFDVHVTASYGNQTGETTFTMSNVTRIVETDVRKGGRKHGSWWSPTWVKVAVIGGAAGAVAGIILATRGGGSSSSSSGTITITPGSPSVGGPH